MVSCFPFGYQYLQDDDSGYVRVRKSPLLEWMSVLRRRSKSAGPSTDRSKESRETAEECGTDTRETSQLSTSGVQYSVKYIGSIEVKQSMKSFDYVTRSELAKECINRVCEAAGTKLPSKRRKDCGRFSCGTTTFVESTSDSTDVVKSQLNLLITDVPNTDLAGTNVILVITCSFLSLTTSETGEVIACHEMPNISFASGGDSETADFIAYVAKNHLNFRACYVFQCKEGQAQSVITSIGQAFEQRFQLFLKRAPRTLSVPDKLENLVFSNTMWQQHEYYNDLLSRAPSGTSPHFHRSQNQERRPTVVNQLNGRVSSTKGNRINSQSNVISSGMSNLEGSESPAFTPISQTPPPLPCRRYGPLLCHAKKSLLDEEWFHGAINRQQSEQLVTEDGEFLVRESFAMPGQYVLTSRQNGVCRHLLLVDPAGIVRTKDKTFESIGHLVNYHTSNKLPIMSADSAIRLTHFVPRRRPSY